MEITHGPGTSYLVCATERSGSTLLCELLGATGVAGRPEEFFEFLEATGRPRQPREYFDGVDDADPSILELLPPLVRPRRRPARERQLGDALERGTTPNGVLGSKMMWAYLGDFLAGEPEAALPAALGARQPRRQARPGDLAVARGPDQPVARRGPRRRAASRSTTRARSPTSSAGSRRTTAAGTRGSPSAASSRSRSSTRTSPRDAHATSAGCSSTSGQPTDVTIPDPPMRRQADGRSKEWVERFREEVAGA